MQTAYIYDDVPRCASQFTGKERDAETGLDYFGARYYGSNMGRWMSPAGGPELPQFVVKPDTQLQLWGFPASDLSSLGRKNSCRRHKFENRLLEPTNSPYIHVMVSEGA